jgi:hypothetical protein
MPKRSRKDINETAFSIVQQATGQSTAKEKQAKNPAAVALGRLGGLKGGPARAKKMTPVQRRESALKAAHARWNHKTL